MNIRHIGFGAFLIIALVVGYEAGHVRLVNSKERIVTISFSDKAGKCGVDYPVLVVKSKVHSIQWKSTDKRYYVSFLNLGGSAPQNYTVPGQAPLMPPEDPVIVDGQSRKYVVNGNGYYYYAIFTHAPTSGSNDPCKRADDDHDTGLNVKP
ncbi:MAG: hypothetical protein JOZ14_13905 [Acidobacteria bacterium]|nr:hypothetical protein [Acidobacteriota bacterium]